MQTAPFTRRCLLAFGAAACLGVPKPAAARTVGGPLRLGADVGLVESRLAPALQRAFERDTGLGVRLVGAPVMPLLDALAAGEVDAAIGNAPVAEQALEAQGLLHDRRPLATGAFVLVGPTAKAAVLPFRRGEPRTMAEALAAIGEAGIRNAAGAAFVTVRDGSGACMAEESAWRDARIAPQAPWYRTLAAGESLVGAARAQGSWAVVERGAWLAQGGSPQAIHVDGSPGLVEVVHVMRAFRSPHPAARLFVGWIAGPRGRSVVAQQRGYRPPLG